MQLDKPANSPDDPDGSTRQAGRVPVIVATSVMLTFISFWRAAAIVLCDLGSSAFYAGGIAEKAVGKAAPWFILGVMFLSCAVAAIYIEACVMFVRGGVYRVVKSALGSTLAKLSVSALMFDYILTGPISGVSAGHYLMGVANELLKEAGFALHLPEQIGSAVIAIGVVLYFWHKNLKGLHESSDKALRIMQVTTVMVVVLIGWAVWTMVRRGAELPPWPTPANLAFAPDAIGWLPEDWVKAIGVLGILIAFGHSILAMSGEETLAQVNREIAHPKVKNLKRTAVIVFGYSLIFTSLVSFFAVMLIPDSERPHFYENLIGGLAMHLDGPLAARMAFHVFVVVVGFLILSGAVNTAIIGSNGVLNRVSEDGVLSSWFRRPHHRYGTSYRIINMVALLQIGTIIASRGDVYLLGEAYAFGVIWSFVFNSLSMYVLRHKSAGPREWRVPLNLRIGKREIPIGILVILSILVVVAVVNLVTKEVATISGLIFTVGFFSLFTVSEHLARRDRSLHGLDQFQLIRQERVDLDVLSLRPGPVLVPTRDYRSLKNLEVALGETDTTERDVVVMTARIIQGMAAGYRDIYDEHLFTSYEQTLFTNVVNRAEKLGKPVKLLTVPSNETFTAAVNVAVRLRCSRVYMGASEKLSLQAQARMIGRAWEVNDDPDKVQFDLVIVPEKGSPQRFQIGAHAPVLSPDDVDLTHQLWLDIVEKSPEVEFHHKDVVSLALRNLSEELRGPRKNEILQALKETAPRAKGRRGAITKR
jgi:amino acid transporter